MIQQQARPPLNPFHYGNPVPPNCFVGRGDALRTVFSRIHNGESTAVIGEPHIGKSSMQRYILTRWTEWLPGDVTHMFVEFDCHMFEERYEPARFWDEMLAMAVEHLYDQSLRDRIEAVRQGEFDSRALNMLFQQISAAGARVVLLVDEFDLLLYHTRFPQTDFFGTLRVLSIKTNGLAVVSFSRLSVAEMHRRIPTRGGSPFFNNMIEVRLLPLRLDEIDYLIDQALVGTGVAFSPQDRAYIARISGRHPFLVQIACAAMFDAHATFSESNAHGAGIEQMLQTRAASHFEDVWRHLTPGARKAMALLAVTEYLGSVPPKLGPVEAHDVDLRWLAAGNLIETTGNQRCALWRGGRWRVSAKSLAIWLITNRKWSDTDSEATVTPPAPEERHERIEFLLKKIDELRRRLQERELQLASFGPSADPLIVIEARDLRRMIADDERELRRLGG